MKRANRVYTQQIKIGYVTKHYVTKKILIKIKKTVYGF